MHAIIFLSLTISLTWGAHLRPSDPQSESAQGSRQGHNADNPFLIWKDYPGSDAYKQRKPTWYDTLWINSNTSFVSSPSGRVVNVNYNDHKPIHLFADPAFQQKFDDQIREFSGPVASRISTGVLDRCGWPNLTASEAPPELQYFRRTTPLNEDFRDGLNSSRIVLGLQKGCCEHNRSLNVGIEMDEVSPGVTKPVLALTSFNMDDPANCPNPSPGHECHKIVRSAGIVASADIFASGRYEVIAKVPAKFGLVFALWTFHYEMHLPNDCNKFSCYCMDMPPGVQVPDACEFRYDGSGRPCKYATVCDDNQDGWDPVPPPPPPVMSPAQCGAMHGAPDPQFLGNASIGGWATEVNHEIDIEIVGSCLGSTNVCNSTTPIPGARSCMGDYSTANLNAYQWTQNSGTGPGYLPMCVKLLESDGVTGIPLIGDGKYHSYSFIWHTGSGDEQPRVDYFFDSTYLGTNNAFVPTRASRFYIGAWGPTDKNRLWNGYPDDWEGGTPGDGKSYSSTLHISEINITPLDEPRDMCYPSTADMPDGCTPNFQQRWDTCHLWERFDLPPPSSHA